MTFNEYWAEILNDVPVLKALPIDDLNLMRTVSNNAWLNGLQEGFDRYKKALEKPKIARKPTRKKSTS